MLTPRHSLQQIDRTIRQVLPDEPGNRRLLSFLPLAVLGVLLSTNCHLNHIAASLIFAGKAKAILQRLRRWLARDSFIVAPLLPRFAGAFIASRVGPLQLLVDRTQWKHANLLYAALSFRGRALPLAVIILPGPKATHAEELRELLRWAERAIPAGRDVTVIADREFGNVPAISVIREFGWSFCLRFKQDTWLCDPQGRRWRAKDRWPTAGSSVMWPAVEVTLRRYGPLNACVVWHRGETEPWLLVSDHPCGQLPRLYQFRMRIEEMFSDLKGRGFDLEATRIRCPQRLERLAALLSIAYLWLLLVACAAIRRGLRDLVDPATGRALSYTQIAIRLLHYAPPKIADALLQSAAHTILKK
jgi:hypothetical protein